jgi:LysM repeat protein
MGNDISISCRAGVIALAVALSACASQEVEPVPDLAPLPAPEATPPETSATAQDSASTVELQPEAPLRYVVQRGDTLWGISQKFLKDSWQWPELWYANPKVHNPHLIYPGDELYLYWVNGAPRLARVGEGEAPPTSDSGAPPVAALPPGGEAGISPRVREEPLAQAIYSIPLELIRPFLHGPRMVDEDVLDDAPYILDFVEDHLMAGNGEGAYVLDLEDRQHSQYQVVRRGHEYRDPDDNDVIGYEVLPVADSEVRAYGDPSVVYLTRSDMEARAGDYLLPMDQDPLSIRFIPHPPSQDIDGRIISVHNGLSNIGQYQIVTINRGTEQGMEPGHVLEVLATGRKSKDPHSFFGSRVQLPDITAGTAMVFKTAPRVSYALVIKAKREIHILDKVERPGLQK